MVFFDFIVSRRVQVRFVKLGAACGNVAEEPQKLLAIFRMRVGDIRREIPLCAAKFRLENKSFSRSTVNFLKTRRHSARR